MSTAIKKELAVGTCPNCDADMDYMESGETDGDQISEYYCCRTCGADFVVWYKIVAIYERNYNRKAGAGVERQWEPN